MTDPPADTQAEVARLETLLRDLVQQENFIRAHEIQMQLNMLKEKGQSQALGASILAMLKASDKSMDLEYSFFLSHYQATGGDQVGLLERGLEELGHRCWFDQVS